MKILQRNYRHRNLIIFLILSLVYLHSVYSITVGNSIFSASSFHSFFINHSTIFIFYLLTMLAVLKIKNYSEIILLIFLSILVGKNFLMLSNSFNKLTLVLNFIYVIFAFYFFVTWELEVQKASFNPKFSIHDLEIKARFKIPVSIYPENDNHLKTDALITNIDETSCFLLIVDNHDFKADTSKNYFLESIFEDVCFKEKAKLVSAYGKGVGFIFEKSLNARDSWSELYKICLDRGPV